MAELTYLLLLKSAEETGAEKALPESYRWRDLVRHEGEGQLGFYRKMLTHLGEDAPEVFSALWATARAQRGVPNPFPPKRIRPPQVSSGVAQTAQTVWKLWG
jgi:type I restriction enzyme M protein